ARYRWYLGVNFWGDQMRGPIATLTACQNAIACSKDAARETDIAVGTGCRRLPQREFAPGAICRFEQRMGRLGFGRPHRRFLAWPARRLGTSQPRLLGLSDDLVRQRPDGPLAGRTTSADDLARRHL